MDDLEQRVQQFNGLSLPGQPFVMHMGTSYLVNDLWREVQRLRAELEAAQLRLQSDGARRCPACESLLEKHSVYCDNCGTDTPRR